MCYHAVPNGTYCKEYIRTGVCVAVVQGKPNCQSLNGTSQTNLVAADMLIREAIATRQIQPLSLHQMQAQIAVSDIR